MLKYSSYTEVPVFRRQWFFWLSLLFCPITLLIVLTGDVYYQRNNEIKVFGITNRIVIGAICIYALSNVFTNS